MAHLERVVVLVDMDCFYCQVEEKLNPEIKGKPIAVVQYNAWRGGGIIAVNYPARDRGVTRHMRGSEAQQKCPDIILCQVPCVRGKADLTKYREAGKDVAAVLYKFTNLLQRASIDEAYMDITEEVKKRIENLEEEISPEQIPNTHIYGSDNNDFLYDLYNNSMDNEANLRLVVGGIIMEEVRAAVYNETGFRCSAGIAHNKILAKLACGFHKPNQQTILPHVNVPTLYRELPIKKIKSLGGKFGETLSEDLNITYMSELAQFSEKFLEQKYDTRNGSWLYNIARGVDTDPVTVRLCPKSIGCCKRFPGRTSLKTPEDVQHWIGELSEEVSDRLNQELAENNRRAGHMIVHYTLFVNKKNIPTSKSRQLVSYDPKKIAADAFEVIHKANSLVNSQYKNPITYLGIITGKFEEANKNIESFFLKKSSSPGEKKLAESSTDFTSIKRTVEKRNYESELNVEKKNLGTEIFEVDYSLQNKIESCFLKNEEMAENGLPGEIKKSININLMHQNEPENNQLNSFFSKFITKINKNEEIANDVNSEPDSSVNSENYTDIQSKLCAECNTMIPLSDFQCHNDYHLALKLASTDNVFSSEKLKKSSIHEKKNTNIVNFLQTQNTSQPADENTEICDICKEKIPLTEFLDHLDYHEAKKLHKELNTGVIKPKMTKETNKNDLVIKKNKLKRIGPSVNSNSSKKFKPISNFFKPC